MEKIRFFLTALLVMASLGIASAQNRTVRGTVTAKADGQPVVGAYVQAEGTKIGTITGLDGDFQLDNVPSSAKNIVVTFMGYKEAKAPIAAVVNFVLEDDAEVLEGVVVTGMQKMDRRLFTGSAAKVDASEAKLDGMADISRSLEGKVAGVSVQNVSGTFGTAPKIRVRGATSIYGSSKPLWVVDGVIMQDVVDVSADELSSGDANTLISSAIAGLNSDDIESFDILKDGSATSIYGARAMAGVIVITTKKGRAGQSHISYTGEYTTRLKPMYSTFNIMNSQDQMSIYQELAQKGWLNYAETANSSASGIYGKMYQLMSQYSGGTEKSNYYASLSVMDDPGWTLQSKVQRYTANLNVTHKIFDNLSLNMISNASYRKQRAPGTLGSSVDLVFGEVKRDFDINPYSYALNTSRALDPDEFYTRNYAPFNIIHELENNYLDLNIADFRVQGELSWKPFKQLELTALGAYKRTATTNEHYILDDSNQAQAYRAMQTATIRDANPFLYDDPDQPYEFPISVMENGGIFQRTDNSMNGWDFRATANFNNTFAGNHIVNLYGGMEVNSIDRHNTWFRGWGMQYNMGEIANYNYKIFKKGNEENTQYYTLGNTRERSAAFFANGTYSYKGRYILNGTVRYEGTNKLGKSRSARWLPTWNISGAWNAHEESFMKDLYPTVSHLSLKASYSLTADRGPAWVDNSLVKISSETPWRPSAGTRESALYIESLANEELTYEKKKELNLGFEAGLFDNRVNLTFDWYTRDNYDLIGIINTQGLGGEVQKYGNVASMDSDGFEVSLTTTNVKTRNFSWTTNFIYSHSHNEVTMLKNTSRMIDLISGTGFTMEGYPVRSLFSVQFMGLNEEGLPTFLNQDKEVTVDDIYFQTRMDTKSDFLKYSGSVDPTDVGSFGNTFQYKNLRLNVFLTYSFGNVIRLDPVFDDEYNDLDSMPKEFKNRWVVPGDEEFTTIPVIASYMQNRWYRLNSDGLSYAYNAYNYSTERIAKGDFIRMKEISLSYDFPKKWLNPIKLNALSLKLQATNLFLLYADKKLNGQDPEFFNTGKLNGQDPEFFNTGGVAVPVPKQFTLTLRVGF